MTDPRRSGLFCALLKHWRGQRGMSQLDLALAADVSARHVSFLETGRSQPSEDMVLQLASALSVPFRHQNEMLLAAGFAALFDEPDARGALPDNIRRALERLKTHHDPFPLVVLDRLYNILDVNRAAAVLMPLLAHDPSAVGQVNGMRALFDERLWQPYIVNYDEVGRHLMWRLQREALQNPADQGLADLVAELFALPTVDDAWRKVDLTRPSEPTLVVHLQKGDLALSFFTTVTAFSAPQNVTVEELRIESYFPHDDHTAQTCAQLLAASEG